MLEPHIDKFSATSGHRGTQNTMRRKRQTLLIGRLGRFLHGLFHGSRKGRSWPRFRVARYNLEALNRERRKHGLTELHFHDGYAGL